MLFDHIYDHDHMMIMVTWSYHVFDDSINDQLIIYDHDDHDHMIIPCLWQFNQWSVDHIWSWSYDDHDHMIISCLWQFNQWSVGSYVQIHFVDIFLMNSLHLFILCIILSNMIHKIWCRKILWLHNLLRHGLHRLECCLECLQIYNILCDLFLLNYFHTPWSTSGI